MKQEVICKKLSPISKTGSKLLRTCLKAGSASVRPHSKLIRAQFGSFLLNQYAMQCRADTLTQTWFGMIGHILLKAVNQAYAKRELSSGLRRQSTHEPHQTVPLVDQSRISVRAFRLVECRQYLPFKTP